MHYKRRIFFFIALILSSCSAKRPSPRLNLKTLALNAQSPEVARQILDQIKIMEFSFAFAQVLVDDLIWLKESEGPSTSDDVGKKILAELNLQSGAAFGQFLTREVKNLTFGDYCQGNEVACTYPQTPHTIFISRYFFRLNRVSRLATLVHEAYHLYKDKPHVGCKNKFLKNHSCDEDVYSAFGMEALFLQQLLMDCRCFGTPLEGQIQRAMAQALIRINKT